MKFSKAEIEAVIAALPRLVRALIVIAIHTC